MNDEEFKKKLETILGNLYRIDREVREYLGREKSHAQCGINSEESYQENKKIIERKQD